MRTENFFIVAAGEAAYEISDYLHSLMLAHVGATSMDGFYWAVDCPWRDENDTLRLISAIMQQFQTGPVIYISHGIGYRLTLEGGSLVMARLGAWRWTGEDPTAFEILGGYFTCNPL